MGLTHSSEETSTMIDRSEDVRHYVEGGAAAQDVIDALRFVLMAQKDPAELVKIVSALLDLAPETEDDRGLSLIIRLVSEGGLKVALVDG